MFTNCILEIFLKPIATLQLFVELIDLPLILAPHVLAIIVTEIAGLATICISGTFVGFTRTACSAALRNSFPPDGLKPSGDPRCLASFVSHLCRVSKVG
jgi:hypothetical protein